MGGEVPMEKVEALPYWAVVNSRNPPELLPTLKAWEEVKGARSPLPACRELVFQALLTYCGSDDRRLEDGQAAEWLIMLLGLSMALVAAVGFISVFKP